MAKAVKVYRGFTMDYSTEKMAAVRADGAVFARYKEKHPRYGYRWTRWKAASEAYLAGMNDITASPYTPNVRLPG